MGLPPPTPVECEHARLVRAHVDRAIADAGGAIRFSDYMNRVLYAPGLGYYSAGAMKIGAAGDFVTAPEIGGHFAACLARTCAEVLAQMGDGDIVEPGGGTGKLAVGILRHLGTMGRLPARYRILEVSADLRERQRRLILSEIPRLVERVEWLDEPPDAVRGVVLANEVLDALPCERFRVDEGGPVYLGVGMEGGELTWVDLPADRELAARVEMIRAASGGELSAGFESEWIPGLAPFVSTLAGSLERGIMLLIDYGLSRRELYHDGRDRGSLMCHYRHRAHGDPLILTGLQDITSWVDFTEVAEAATAAGLELEGYTTQAGFLLAAGIDVVAGPPDQDARALAEDALALRTLLLPGEMGEKFKVIGFSREWTHGLAGLTGRDLSGSL
jgi:SAM-dependent MidA family methyltransferase